jgi:hypothetical protein
MMQAFQHHRNAENQGPIIGVYTCLFCERRFSTKRQLKRHYARAHEHSLPNYEGNAALSESHDAIENAA